MNQRTLLAWLAVGSMALAGSAMAQRPGPVLLDGGARDYYTDDFLYGLAGANAEVPPWAAPNNALLDGTGGEIFNLLLCNSSSALNVLVGGTAYPDETALVLAISRPGLPTITSFPGVDGANGFFQTPGTGPGLGGATLPPFNFLVSLRVSDIGDDSIHDVEVAVLDVESGIITYTGVLDGGTNEVRATAVDAGAGIGASIDNIRDVDWNNDFTALLPETAATGMELVLPFTLFEGSLGPVAPGEVWSVFPVMTSFDGELGSNHSVPANTLVGTPADADYAAALTGAVAEYEILAPRPVLRPGSGSAAFSRTLLRGATGVYDQLWFLNVGEVAAEFAGFNAVPGFEGTLPVAPATILPNQGFYLRVNYLTDTPGAYTMNQDDVLFSVGAIETPTTFTLTVDEHMINGRADDPSYVSIGTTAGIHSAAPTGITEAFAYIADGRLNLAATGALAVNESIFFFIGTNSSGYQGIAPGNPLPGGSESPSVFMQIAGTRLDHVANVAVRATRHSPTNVGFSTVLYYDGDTAYEFGYVEASPTDGTPHYSWEDFFPNSTSVMSFNAVADLGSVTDEGFEASLDLDALLLYGTTIHVTAVMTTSGGYEWSSDIIPPVYQQGAGSLGHSPDLRVLAGHQAVQIAGPATREVDLAQGSLGFLNGGSFQMPRATATTAGTVRTFSILNSGTAPLSVTALDLNGDAELVIENLSEGIPAVIPGGGAVTFDVRLSGATPGPFSGLLALQTNDADEPIINLTIDGIIADQNSDLQLSRGSAIILEGATEDFGLLTQDLRPRVRTVTVTSIGGLPLEVTGLSLADGTEFALSHVSPALPATLDPDETLTFRLTLRAETVGVHSDVLTIESDDANLPTMTVNLMGQVTGSQTSLYGTATIDGDLEGDELPFGYPVASQKLRTHFGDAAGALIGGGGSELNDLYITNDATNLYLSIPGNVEANGNTVLFFIDRVADTTGASGSVPPITSAEWPWAFGSSANIDNTPMPDGLNVDLMLALKIKLVSGQVRTTLQVADVRTLAGQQFAFSHGAPPMDVAIYSPGGTYGWAIHGKNTAGVDFGTGFTTRDPFTATQGIELSIPLSVLEGSLGAVERGERIRMFAAVSSEWVDWWSNQFLPSLDIPAGNLAASTNLSSTGVNLQVAEHVIQGPPQTLAAGPDQTVTFEVGPGIEIVFDDLDVTTPGTLYVVRHFNKDNRANINPLILINEHWSLVGTAGFTFSTATITFPYDEANLGGIAEEDIVLVHKVEGDVLAASIPVVSRDTVANTVTIEVTGPGFSDWYLSASFESSVGDWMLY